MELLPLNLTTQVRWYFANVRARDWGGYVGMSILGYLVGIGTFQRVQAGYLDLAAYLVTVALYLGFSFSINNCFDYEGDWLGDKVSRNPIASGKISMRGGVWFSTVLASAGLALTGLWFSGGPLLIYGLMLLLSGAYSVPPLRLKSVPIIDLASHGLFFGSLIVLYGIFVTGGFNSYMVVSACSTFVISLIVELRNQIDDISEDSATGVDTTACRIGEGRANALLNCLLVLHMSMLVYIISHMGSLAITAVSIVFFTGLALHFIPKLDRSRFLLLMEKITPLVYLIFLLNILL